MRTLYSALSNALVALVFIVSACSTTSKSTDPVLPPVGAPEGGNPWFRAARTADIATLKKMIDEGHPIDGGSQNGITALMVASRAGNVETVKWLIANGADAAKMDPDDQSALTHALGGTAAPMKQELIVDELIKAGANPFKPDSIGFYPIREMVVRGMEASLRKINYTDKKSCDRVERKRGEATLSQAARRMGKIQLAEFFESQGCW